MSLDMNDSEMGRKAAIDAVEAILELIESNRKRLADVLGPLTRRRLRLWSFLDKGFVEVAWIDLVNRSAPSSFYLVIPGLERSQFTKNHQEPWNWRALVRLASPAELQVVSLANLQRVFMAIESNPLLVERGITSARIHEICDFHGTTTRINIGWVDDTSKDLALRAIQILWDFIWWNRRKILAMLDPTPGRFFALVEFGCGLRVTVRWRDLVAGLNCFYLEQEGRGSIQYLGTQASLSDWRSFAQAFADDELRQFSPEYLGRIFATELIGTEAPEGRGTELLFSPPPAGNGQELIPAEDPTDPNITNQG